MALFTELFSRDHNPYKLTGYRWYKIHLVSNGSAFTIDYSKSDMNNGEASPDSTTYIAIRIAGARILDYVLDYALIPGTSSTYSKAYNLFAAGNGISLRLPSPDRYNELDMYILLNRK